MKAVRTRFAPSPTGFLHVGGVRTALFNYLYAKKHSGQFLLRLEDTDRERYVPEGVEQIVEALDWMGLKPDDGFWISEGKHQNIEFVQSERLKTGIYQKFAEQLVRSGLAYYSPTTPEQLNSLREKAKKDRKPFVYRREMDPNNSQEIAENTPIRFDVMAYSKQFNKDTEYIKKKNDKLMVVWSEPRHTFGFYGSDEDDFIIIKGDGFPTYNFANVVDDVGMGITDVMRGDEFVASTPKHIILYHALGLEDKMPEFIHLPVINGTDGKKLSKRTGDTNALDYRDKGYLPEALLNFLVLLGWNDGTEQEIFSLRELEEKFSLDRVNKSPAVFDPRRLDWINGHYIRGLGLDDLYEKVENFWPKEASEYDDTYKKSVLGLIQERLKYFAELPQLTRFFFADLVFDPELISGNKQLKKLDKGELKDLLLASQETLEQSDFSQADLQDRLNKLLETTGQKPGVLFSLIRIATTWAPASPALADSLRVLGKERSVQRIKKTLQLL